jgi:hypothetical protein
MSSDIVDLLRRIGLCAPREALLALLTHATKSRRRHERASTVISTNQPKRRGATKTRRRGFWRRLGALPPGVAIDVDDVAVLGEPIDEGHAGERG